MALDTALTRIEVKNGQNCEQLYSLILQFWNHPERALSVTEFVYRPPVQDGPCRKEAPPAWRGRRKRKRETSDETGINHFINTLGLNEKKRQQWIKALTWMKPELVDERRRINENEPVHDIQAFFRYADAAFTVHAAAVLLMLCPNIEKLTYEDDHRSQDAVWYTLRRNNYGLVPKQRLQKLRQVRLLPTTRDFMGDERCYVACDLLGLLRMFHRLPSVETFSMDAICPDCDGEHFSNFPPASANFTKIQIGHSQIPSAEMAALIRASKRLEAFTFSTGGKASADGSFPLVYRKTIGKALDCHKASLTRLDLDLDEVLLSGAQANEVEDEIEESNGSDDDVDLMEGFWDQDKEEMKGPLHFSTLVDDRVFGATMGSLHEFTRLTHLSIGIELLLGPRCRKQGSHRIPLGTPFRLIDALPPSLEYLLLREYTKGEDEHFDGHVDELMRLKDGKLPKLDTVEGFDYCVRGGKTVTLSEADANPNLLWHVIEFEGELFGRRRPT